MNFMNSFVLLAVVGVAYVSAFGHQGENPMAAEQLLKKGPQSKIYIEEPIVQVLDPKLVDPKDVQNAVAQSDVAKDVENNNVIKPKMDVDANDAKSIDMSVIQPANKPSSDNVNQDLNEQLPPIPIMDPFSSILSKFPPLPPFVQKILNGQRKSVLGGETDPDNKKFDSNELPEENDAEDLNDSSEEDNVAASDIIRSNQPHGFMSIFLFKSNRNPMSDSASDQPQQGIDELGNQGIKTNLLILKIMPKQQSQFGGEDEISDKKAVVSLLGGPSDPDNSGSLSAGSFNKIHLFGGSSDFADHINFMHQQMAGNEENLINQNNNNNNFPSDHPETIFAKIRNFFRHGSFMPSDEQQQQASFLLNDNVQPYGDDMLPPPQSLPEDGENSMNGGHHKKKCMMFSFMRLKASAYYRTIIHMLFFTGIALFILFAALLTLRTFKRNTSRRIIQQYGQPIASIDSEKLSGKMAPVGGNGKGGLFWFSVRDSYGADGAKSTDLNATLMPPPPPAYDQVKNAAKSELISSVEIEMPVDGEKNKSRSSLINSLVSSYKGRYESVKTTNADDTASISSMPPEYEENKKKEPKA